jgi:predicted nucleic acid-binding protein
MAGSTPPPELAAVKTWLLDTGPLVAYLDGSDSEHSPVTSKMDAFDGRLATTSAVITEAMYFVSATADGPRILADFVHAAAMEVYDLCQRPELTEAAKLMRKYQDTPMDFADATLVLLSEALSVGEILTLDRRGFAAYRTRRRGHFRLVLDIR